MKDLLQCRATEFFGNERWKTSIGAHHPLRRLGLSERGCGFSATPLRCETPLSRFLHDAPRGVVSSGEQRRSQTTQGTSADSFRWQPQRAWEILPPNSCSALTAHLLELPANSALTCASASLETRNWNTGGVLFWVFLTLKLVSDPCQSTPWVK